MKRRGHPAIPSGSVHFGPHLQTYLNLNLLLSSISERNASLPVAPDPNIHSLHWVALFIFYFNSFPENSTHMQAFPIQQCIYLECKCLCISVSWFFIPLKFFLRFLFPYTDFLKGSSALLVCTSSFFNHSSLNAIHFCVYHITEISQATQCLTQFPWTAFLSWFHGIPLSWRFYSLVKSSVSSSYSSSSVLSLNVVVPFHSRLFSLSTFSLGNVIILFTTRVSAISNSLAQIYLPRSRLVSPATSWISPFEYPHT